MQGRRKYLTAGQRKAFLAAGEKAPPSVRSLGLVLADTGCRIISRNENRIGQIAIGWLFGSIGSGLQPDGLAYPGRVNRDVHRKGARHPASSASRSEQNHLSPFEMLILVLP